MFISHGVMTEIILGGPDCSTTFWGERRFEWPGDTFGSRIHGISVASPAALIRYRQAHDSLRTL